MGVAPFKIFNVVGARPNMMKMAPIVAEMRRHPDLHPVLVHTGQHYDFRMSQVFLEQLKMGEPDYNLQVGSGSHHAQTAQILKTFGELVEKDRPDLIVVAGDVNSTIACALVAAKEGIPIAHVESGLRSYDRTMPEEVNRILTDALADLLFTTEESARENLLREGVAPEKIFFTGNVMIDSLVSAIDTARNSKILGQLGVKRGKFGILTLHRPSNVDDRDRFRTTLQSVAQIAEDIPIIFPIHPRSAVRAADLRIENMHSWDGNAPVGDSGLWTIPPTSYIDFLCLMDSSAMVITDSGGIQEETTYLGVPCLTYRENTERPVTVEKGTNRLIGIDPLNLIAEARKVLREGRRDDSAPPPLWDGHAAERIVALIRQYLEKVRLAPNITTSTAK
jgi:UDP-N-acetylglucosamine 2-epimerase (non-hydrolysing)